MDNVALFVLVASSFFWSLGNGFIQIAMQLSEIFFWNLKISWFKVFVHNFEKYISSFPSFPLSLAQVSALPLKYEMSTNTTNRNTKLGARLG